MRQNYKLRLGDGTILLVDHTGLTNWLADRMALVQPAGDELWTPLRSFLVQERSAARRTARYRPQPPSTSREALPLVYPKPLEEPSPGRPVADAATQHPGTPEEARDPIPARADGLPLIPPPPQPRDDADRASPAVAVSPGKLVPPPLPDAALKPAPTPLQAPPLPQAAPPLPQPPASVLPKPPDEEYEVDLRPCLAEAAPEPGPPIEHEDSAPLVAPPTPVEAPDENDVGWMTLPQPPGDEPPGLAAVSWLDTLAPSPAGAPTDRLEEAPRSTPAWARPAPGTGGPFPSHRRFHSLARHAWRAARLWLASLASSSHAALLALWKSIGPGGHPGTTSLFGELVRNPVVGPEAGAPPPQGPPIGAPAGGRIQAEKTRESPRVYRPRRSPHDGLPLLQLEPLDEVEERWVSRRGSAAQRSTDELPEISLEPVDELPGAGRLGGKRARR